MSKYVLLAETGSDIPAETARQKGIYLVPMHVNMGNQTLDDGTFPPSDVISYYENTGEPPRSSACTPEDFAVIFDRIHREHPDKHILYVAYSAVTTCSFQNALTASEGRGYVTCMDTKQVSGGQHVAVMQIYELLEKNPEMSLAEIKKAVQELAENVHMGFVPSTLKYLHAGGRLSNAAYVAGQILNIHPRVEIKDGYLVATRKYRGSMKHIAVKLIQEMTVMYNFRKDHIWLLRSPGLSEEVQRIAEQTAREQGYQQIIWVDTGCVITVHSGPGAFGVIGIET